MNVNKTYTTSAGTLKAVRKNDYYYAFYLNGVEVGNEQDVHRCKFHGLIATMQRDIEHITSSAVLRETELVLMLVQELRNHVQDDHFAYESKWCSPRELAALKAAAMEKAQ